jgi:hypothetical protein
MSATLDADRAFVGDLVGDQPGRWDLAGENPR